MIFRRHRLPDRYLRCVSPTKNTTTMKLLAHHAFFTLLVIGTGCRPAGEPAEPQLPDGSTQETDIAAITALTSSYDAAATAGDTETLSALYAEDAVQMPPGEPPLVGKAAIRQRMDAFNAEYTDAVDSRAERVRVSGDLATYRGSYTESVSPKDGGDPRLLEGNWMLVLQREPSGQWLIVEEMWTNLEPE